MVLRVEPKHLRVVLLKPQPTLTPTMSPRALLSNGPLCGAVGGFMQLLLFFMHTVTLCRDCQSAPCYFQHPQMAAESQHCVDEKTFYGCSSAAEFENNNVPLRNTSPA